MALVLGTRRDAAWGAARRGAGRDDGFVGDTPTRDNPLCTASRACRSSRWRRRDDRLCCLWEQRGRQTDRSGTGSDGTHSVGSTMRTDICDTQQNSSCQPQQLQSTVLN